MDRLAVCDLAEDRASIRKYWYDLTSVELTEIPQKIPRFAFLLLKKKVEILNNRYQRNDTLAEWVDEPACVIRFMEKEIIA